ncbi:MAG: glutathione S-transferase [Pseudomonadota bacterium]
MITLHHLEHSRSQRILWLLEELELDYRIQRYARNPDTQLAPASLKTIHPLGKSPVLTDTTSGESMTLAESGTIIEYLARTYGSGQWAPSTEHADYWAYHYWMQYAEASLMPPLLIKLIFDKLRTEPPFFIRPVTGAIAAQVDRAFTNQQINTHFEYVDQHLKANEWLLGATISAADIQISFPLEAAVARGTAAESLTHIHAYVERFQSRPAYQRALEAGGDYAYGPQS